ncbi:MAG: hypothetical protein QG625_431 [Cyanobacteriota bacterium erpe_2018_sw_39hr_WHONDRS-SW48-000098_B_bin.30]|jgi:hypothetical protein|nr:hypothetical protein [Cyanobacteriota bacterium erpe_2018_sw_39hr_WHONDRS-SW48-000098_B_bin.30]
MTSLKYKGMINGTLQHIEVTGHYAMPIQKLPYMSYRPAHALNTLHFNSVSHWQLLALCVSTS